VTEVGDNQCGGSDLLLHVAKNALSEHYLIYSFAEKPGGAYTG
jgi:hypothetical protein